MNISPLAPASYPDLPAIAGVSIGAGNCGIRYKGRPDVLLATFAPGTQVAGVFTTSLTASAPVLRCRAYLRGHTARALIVNAGNSNAFTGAAGEASVDRIEEAVEKLLGCKKHEVFMASTGVIGVPLPDEKITGILPALNQALGGDFAAAARAIMTTDTFPKQVTHECDLGGTRVRINAIAKGSGMIAPDMATMLGFVFTDAALPAPILQALLTEANARSFNCVTVDGDTSTSDTLLAFATGQAKHPPVTDLADPRLSAFRGALKEALVELAKLIARDGEGATKFITLHVTGAENDPAARRIAMTIANSPLVKTAIAGEDANWGRIVAAVGRAGEKADRDRLRIDIGGITVARDGLVAPDYREEQLMPHMRGREIDIAVDVGIGSGKATVWTCDLTHGYIDINGSYRT